MTQLQQDAARAIVDRLGPDNAAPAEPAADDVVRVDATQVASAVYGSDYYPTAVRRHLLDAIVRLVLKRLAMAALGGRAVVVGLPDGAELVCTVQPAPAAAGAAA